SKLSDRPINQISGDGDEVGDQLIGAPDDFLDKGSADGGPHVDVGELDDSKSVLRGGESVESNANPSHVDRFAHRSEGGCRQSGDESRGDTRSQPRQDGSAGGI